MKGKFLRSAISREVGRVAAANNCNFPVSFNTSSSWVHNAWSLHTSGPAGYTSIEVTFVNALTSSDAELNAHYDFYLRAGIYINGLFFPMLFGGQPEAFVPKEWGIAVAHWEGCIPPNTTFYITNRRVAADNGAAGSYDVITNTSGITPRRDGSLSGTDPTKDFTLGVGVGYGAKCLQPPTISGDTITAISPDPANTGQGYTSGLNLVGWYGPAGAGQPGALHPGSGLTGFGSASGGHLSSVTVSTGGINHDSSNPPLVFVGGGGGFGGAITASYGPSLITGIPRYRTPSVLIHGDSIAAGYGSADGGGDLNANYGWYEQALANRYGVHKIAVSGESATGWLQNDTHGLAFMDMCIRRGLRPSHVILALGVNDFLTFTSAGTLSFVQTNVSRIAAIWRERGAKVLMTTIPPCNTTNASSNKYTTIAEQTPKNSNYTLGSNVDQYNAALLNGTGPKNDGVIDGSSLMRDATVTTAWRVDCYGGATAFCSQDGIHPSSAVGIPFLVANISIPTLSP